MERTNSGKDGQTDRQIHGRTKWPFFPIFRFSIAFLSSHSYLPMTMPPSLLLSLSLSIFLPTSQFSSTTTQIARHSPISSAFNLETTTALNYCALFFMPPFHTSSFSRERGCGKSFCKKLDKLPPILISSHALFVTDWHCTPICALTVSIISAKDMG